MSLNVEELLTNREKEIISHIGKGRSYQYVAQKLLISKETVKKHLQNIYKKLSANNKIEALNKLNRL